jgi:hypothetical protein
MPNPAASQEFDMPVPAVRHDPHTSAATALHRTALAAMPENPLHPMHRDLVARWGERPEPHIDRFALPVRAAVALGSAGLAWAGLIALVKAIV